MRYLLFAIPFLSLTPTALIAADAVHTVEPTLTRPKKASDKRVVEPFDKVRLNVWLPDGMQPLRGALFNPFNAKQVEQKHWQEACRVWGFALIGADYFGVNAVDFAPTLLGGLKTLATDLKRPELANVPFVMVGMSAGAGMCMKFADQMPDRVIALAPVCLEVGPTNDALRNIPTLSVFGEKDGKQFDLLMGKLTEQRKAGARWAIAVQWGRGHEFGGANNLVMPFFDTCIRLRLPADAKLAEGTAKLKEIPEASGWVAVPPTKERPMVEQMLPAAKAVAGGEVTCWFPTQDLARAWHGFVTKGKAAIASPAPLGDGRAFAVVEAGKPVALKLTGVQDLTRFQVFAGGQKLWALDRTDTTANAEFTLEKLPTGIHTLVVVPITGGKDAVPIKPIAVVVK